MKTSISLFLSDILPHRKNFIHKIVKSKIFRNKTTDDVFRQLKAMKLDGFELLLPQYFVTTNNDINEIKKLVKQYHFPVLSVHQQIRLITATKIEEIKRLFEIAHTLDAKVIVLHINSAKKQIFDKKYVQELHNLEKRYKITATFENMEKHIGSLPYKHRWHEITFCDVINKTNFHITFDTVHLAHSGGNIVRFFKNNKDRISNIHLSDYKHHPLNGSIMPMKYKHMPLGDGKLPIDNFLALLQEEKYKGLVTLEIDADLHEAERSTAILNKFAKNSVHISL